MIYRVNRTDAVQYDEYDAHIVIAQSEDDALAHVIADVFWESNLDGDYEVVDITNISDGVLLSSYNAG